MKRIRPISCNKQLSRHSPTVVLTSMGCCIACINSPRVIQLQPAWSWPSTHTCKRLGPNPLTCASMNNCYDHLGKERIHEHDATSIPVRDLSQPVKLPSFSPNYPAFPQSSAPTGLLLGRYLFSRSSAKIPPPHPNPLELPLPPATFPPL